MSAPSRKVLDPYHIENEVYERPDPIKVCRLADAGYDVEARFYCLSSHAVSKLVSEGRQILRGRKGLQVRGPRRPTTPEQERAIVESVFELGSPTAAGKAHGVFYNLVLTLLREAGHETWLKVSAADRMRAMHAANRARVLATTCRMEIE